MRGKYLGKLPARSAHLVLLEPDVAKAFPDSAAVNDALRLVLKAAEQMRKHRNQPARVR